ncbi:FecR family protein [Bacteroides gallinarum]|uniref:FecR family protein n=1 Tax=Bacteroides gallinarum TaxID=376806 RepID=UPI0003601B93|nr:FecR domain-containing protein [Bacteroides gallinarum]
MEHRNVNDMEELLFRYYQGRVTNEEYLLIKTWLESSEENRELMQQLYSIYLATDMRKVMDRVDTEKALKKVSSRMPVRKREIGWRWIQRVAAILFIPLLVSLGVLLQDDKSEYRSPITQIVNVRTNPGMITSVVLPDSSVVYLNSESSLSYPLVFEGKIREVHLTGEAYFEVAKDPSRRFVVSTTHQTQIEVLGTHFNVEAYEKDEEVIATLLEGKVDFLFRENANTRKIELEPGEKLVYNSKVHKANLQKTSCQSEVAWKDGKIILSGTPLREAFRMLEKRYHVEFVITNNRGIDDTYTGVFTNERLERILDHFKISSKIRWRYMEEQDVADRRSKIEIY